MLNNHYIYCLESVNDVDAVCKSLVLPSLELLSLQYGITNTYKTCDDIESFEESISTLLYEDRSFKDYAIIYLIFEGEGNQIKMNNYYYSFEEIAELFEGKLKDKIVHFANTFLLDLDSSTFQYFLDVTGAKALSGYSNKIPVLSTQLDNFYFSLSEEYDDIVELTETLFEKHYAFYKAMGFQVYY